MLKKLFHALRGFFEKEAVQIDPEPAVGSLIDDREIIEIGIPFRLSGSCRMLPVRFSDGSCGILDIHEPEGERRITPWKCPDPHAMQAIRKSISMPRIQRGTGSGVLHIHGRDRMGQYLIKLYGNDKAGRPAAFLR